MAMKKYVKKYNDLLYVVICIAILCLYANYESRRRTGQAGSPSGETGRAYTSHSGDTDSAPIHIFVK